MKRAAIAITMLLATALTGTPVTAQTAPSTAPQTPPVPAPAPATPAPLQPIPSTPAPPSAVAATQSEPVPSPTTQPPLIEFPPPSTHPFLSSTTRASQQSAEDMLRQMLQPANQGAKPLQPVPDAAPPADMTSGRGAVIPTATTQPLKPDGTLLFDQVGRLTKTPDGKFLELTFDADAYGNTDPPLLLLPNDKLSKLEDLVNNTYVDMKIHASGEITVYRGRNYLLLTRWSQVADVSQPLK